MSLTPAQTHFLTSCYQAASTAQHIYPAMASCEAALESSWGTSQLAVQAHNLFGMKQKAHPEFDTLSLPTREFLHGQWVTVEATWVEYPDWAACFKDRMTTLTSLAPSYPHYAMGLEAKTPEEYVIEISRSWSTDPQRAAKCIEIYHAHLGLFSSP